MSDDTSSKPEHDVEVVPLCRACAPELVSDASGEHGEPWSHTDFYVESSTPVCAMHVVPIPKFSRARACVNALAGIDDPAAYIVELRHSLSAALQQVANAKEVAENREREIARKADALQAMVLELVSEWEAK
jgi:hypothetical protein